MSGRAAEPWAAGPGQLAERRVAAPVRAAGPPGPVEGVLEPAAGPPGPERPVQRPEVERDQGLQGPWAVVMRSRSQALV
ncbi:hypothetical protein GCM10009825_36870 [Arthrobacter humicola]|uniref:Uncharacterized protein n=1 Tax=Arthrobacter humicola TaxID=409291 RepID=A0ABN2ZN99_9MICC